MMRPIGEEASAQVESDACAHASPCFHARAPPTAPHETARRMRRRMPASRIPLPPPLPALPAATPLPRETVCALRPSLAACLLLIPPPGRAELHPQLRSSQLRSSHPPQTNRRRSNKKKTSRRRETNRRRLFFCCLFGSRRFGIDCTRRSSHFERGSSSPS